MIPIGVVVGEMIAGTILGLIFAGVRHLNMKKQVHPISGLIFAVLFFVMELAIIALSSQFQFGVAKSPTTVTPVLFPLGV